MAKLRFCCELRMIFSLSQLAGCRSLSRSFSTFRFSLRLNLLVVIRNCLNLQREGVAVSEIHHCCNLSRIWCQVSAENENNMLKSCLNKNNMVAFKETTHFKMMNPGLQKTSGKVMLKQVIRIHQCPQFGFIFVCVFRLEPSLCYRRPEHTSLVLWSSP